MAPEGGFIIGIDAGSGEELWRFQTVAGPDDPGGHTLNDIALVVGQPGLHAQALIGHAMQASGDISRFSGLTREGSSLVVFALP